MSNARTLSARLNRCRSQRGQAIAEYLVVTSAIAFALLAVTGDIVIDQTSVSPITALITYFKSMFSAYSYTLSLP